MSQLGFGLIVLVLSLSAGVPQKIERAFLENNPELLYTLLIADEAIHISFPAPISFSDPISNEQAFFLFQKIFRTHATFEFFPETALFRAPGNGRFIFKARWSFLNRNGNQDVFQIYFLIRSRPEAARLDDFWRIAEIKAERLY